MNNLKYKSVHLYFYKRWFYEQIKMIVAYGEV